MNNHKGKIYFFFGSVIFIVGIYYIFGGSSEYINPKEYISSKSKIEKKDQENKKTSRSHILNNGDKTSSKSEVERSIAGRPQRLIFKQRLRRKERMMEKRHGQSSKMVDEKDLVASFESGEKKFSLVADIYAIDADDFVPNDYEKVGEINGLFLVKSADGKPASAFAVVKNEDTKNLAIFTGKLRVKLKDFSEAHTLIDTINSGIVNDAEKVEYSMDESLSHIDIMVYSFDNYEKTMFIYKTLNTEPFQEKIERVTIDLIEWKRTVN